MKYGKLGWAGHVAGVGETNTSGIVMANLFFGNTQLAVPRGCVVNIKADCGETDCADGGSSV